MFWFRSFDLLWYIKTISKLIIIILKRHTIKFTTIISLLLFYQKLLKNLTHLPSNDIVRQLASLNYISQLQFLYYLLYSILFFLICIEIGSTKNVYTSKELFLFSCTSLRYYVFVCGLWLLKRLLAISFTTGMLLALMQWKMFHR